jgi:hypothetical protein
MKYTMDDLHRMDPAQLISYDGRRPMTVIEVIRHLVDGRWPAEPEPKPTPTPQPDH